MGDDLDALQRASGQRFEVLLEALCLEVRRLVVDPNGHLCAAAILDVAFGIHLHAWGVLQCISGVAALYAGVIAYVVEHLLAVGAVERTRSRYLHLVQCG